MKEFFDPSQPVKTVRAFYSMLYGWNEKATIQLSDKANHRAALGGETITDLVSSKRRKFKDYVENRYVYLAADENRDDFFARYDEALDAVDRASRRKHGIFSTDLDLSKFVLLNNANRSFFVGCVAQVVTAKAKNGKFGLSAFELSEGNTCA
jgi:hypothetical protein